MSWLLTRYTLTNKVCSFSIIQWNAKHNFRLGRVVTNWQVWLSASNRWWRNVVIRKFAELTMENKQLFWCPWTNRCPINEPSESHSFYIHYSCYKQWKRYGISHLDHVQTILIRKHVPLANRKYQKHSGIMRDLSDFTVKVSFTVKNLFESQKNQNVSCFYRCQIETWLSSGVPQGSVLGPVLLFVHFVLAYREMWGFCK